MRCERAPDTSHANRESLYSPVSNFRPPSTDDSATSTLKEFPLNIALWILQGILGVIFLTSGLMHLGIHKPKLAPRQPWVEDYSANAVRLIGVTEILTSCGVLILPFLDILPWIAPLAAFAMAGILTGAFFAHRRRNETRMALAVTGLRVIALIVVVGRLMISPL